MRIVGPAFHVVAGWHAAGIPFAVVKQGVDRALSRDRAKATGAARRPLRIEFCEADVQDAFAAWRRAVGIGMAGAGPGEGAAAVGERDMTAPSPAAGVPASTADAEPGSAARSARGPSLAAHVDRAMQRLTQALLDLPRFAPDEAAAARAAMEAALGTLDRLQAETRRARGEARAALLATLATADEALGCRACWPACRLRSPAIWRGRRAPNWRRSPVAWRRRTWPPPNAPPWRGWPGTGTAPRSSRRAPAARGESPAAFDGRCIPAFGVARRSQPPVFSLLAP